MGSLHLDKDFLTVLTAFQIILQQMLEPTQSWCNGQNHALTRAD